MDLTQRALILRRHGHPHEEIAALLGVEVAAVAAVEMDPSGSPLVAGSGSPELLLFDDIFTPAAGFSFDGSNSPTCWIEGSEFVVYAAYINNDIAIADTDNFVTIGAFDPEYEASTDFNFVKPELWTHLFGDDGLLLVRYRIVPGSPTTLTMRIQETGTMSADSGLAVSGFRFPLASAFA